MPTYLEKPTNPGVDDGLCALCKKEIPEKQVEDAFCHGCGYHVCEGCSKNHNLDSKHFVIDHSDETEDEDEDDAW